MLWINNYNTRKRWKLGLVLTIIILLEFSPITFVIFARTEQVQEFWKEDTILPNESKSYHFPNNIIFEIKTDSLIELYIEYDNKIQNRQTSFMINNSESISLNIQSKTSMKNFGFSDPPQSPKKGNQPFRFRYNCIFKVRTNTTIENLTIRYRKSYEYGLNPNINYSLAIFELSQESWEVIDTQEKVNASNSETYLESSFLDINENTNYFITLFEISTTQPDWTWLIITILVISIGIISLTILISKRDYIRYLRTRMVSIEKGAHRLSLDEVLENDNRNKIIDLILNEPGIHFNELLRKTGLAAGNLVWHLDILLTYKIIGKKRIGNFLVYFPYYQKNPISNIDLKLQKSKLTLEILELIEKNPGIWNNLITKRMKVDHKTILYHLNKLKDLGLLYIQKEGRKKKLFPNLESDYFKYKNNNNKV